MLTWWYNDYLHQIYYYKWLKDSKLLMYPWLYINYEFPQVAPFLSLENFLSNPVDELVFNFSQDDTGSILLIQKAKDVLERVDLLISKKNLNAHACLILQAGAQTTMRLASKRKLRPDWNTSVEIPFCLHIIQEGYCSRTLDAEDIALQIEWMTIFEEVLIPLNDIEQKYIPIIAPQQTSMIVKNALRQSRQAKKNLEATVKDTTTRIPSKTSKDISTY